MEATGQTTTVRRRPARAVAVFLAICVLALLCAACQSPPVLPTPTATTPVEDFATPSVTAQQTEEPAYLPAAAEVELVVAGEPIHTIAINDDAGKKVLMDAIFNHLIKSAAWPGDDPETIRDRITITVNFARDEGYPTVYHVFERDGHPCMQAGQGRYSTISDEVYLPLHELAMGYTLPQALTIRSGKNEIKATALAIKPGQDGKRFTPSQMAAHIQYLELDPKHRKEILTPFTPYAGGKKVYGLYRLYDERFEEKEVLMPSGLEPQTYLFTERKPGRYIVELETSFGEGDEAVRYQYFFGVIVN